MYQKDVGKIELKKPDIKKIAGAEMIKFQQNLDELPASCEREAPGRTGSLWPLQFLQFLEYRGIYLDLQSHQNCLHWEGGDSSEENGVQVGREKGMLGRQKHRKYPL